jgi:hypothetical protein
MAKQAHKISKKWIEQQNRLLFREFWMQPIFLIYSVLAGEALSSNTQNV